MKKTIALCQLLFFFLFSYISGKAQSFHPDQNSYYHIVNLANNEFLTNPGHGSKEKDKYGSEAKLITAKIKAFESTMQEWRFVKVGSEENLYMIVNRHFDNYIDVPYGRKNVNETVFGYKNKGGQNQQFYVILSGNNQFFITPKISGHPLTMVSNTEEHCLYRKEERSTIGGEVVNCRLSSKKANYVKQTEMKGSKNQLWKIILIK